MKKALAFLLATALLLTVAGCGGSGRKKSKKNGDLLTVWVLEKVEIEEEDYSYVTTFEYDEDNFLISQRDDYEDGYYEVYDYEYDEVGHMILSILYFEEYEYSRHEYEYDKDGKLVEEIYSGSGGNEKRSYQYDKDGNLEEVRYTGGFGGDRLHTFEYTFDDKDRVIEQREYQNDAIYCVTTYQYDDKDNLSEYTLVFQNGSYRNHMVYQYDARGCVKTAKIMDDGECVGERVYKYKEMQMTQEQADALLKEWGKLHVVIEK